VDSSGKLQLRKCKGMSMRLLSSIKITPWLGSTVGYCSFSG
jgi:hypothetical protein